MGRNVRGVSLIELLVGLTVFGLAVAGSFSLIGTGIAGIEKTRQLSQTMENMTGAALTLSKLAMADATIPDEEEVELRSIAVPLKCSELSRTCFGQKPPYERPAKVIPPLGTADCSDTIVYDEETFSGCLTRNFGNPRKWVSFEGYNHTYFVPIY